MNTSCIELKNLEQKLKPEIIESINTLTNHTRSLQLSTVDKNNSPLASYTPYVLIENLIYIFVSELALHTKNLLETSQASIMIIEDESQAKNIYARKRLVLNCMVSELNLADSSSQEILTSMEAQHGNTVTVLKSLPDFHLFKLHPTGGHFVQGFGQAFEI